MLPNINRILFKNVRFTLYSPVSVKIEYSQDGKFIDEDLFVTDINEVKQVKPEIKETKDAITIITDNLKIYYKHNKKPLSKENLKIWYKFNDKYKKWEYGDEDNRNLKGSILDLFWYPKKKREISNGVLSRNGYYVYEDHTSAFWTEKNEWAVQKNVPGLRILFFIGYGSDYKLGLKEFSGIFGKVPMLPSWAFGFWYSRYYAYHQDEFIELVDKYRELGIPIDVMVVDTDWRKHVWNGYDWAEQYFPDPAGFISTMKEKGIKLSLNDHPGYNFSEIVPQDDSTLRNIYKFLNIKSGEEWRCNWADRKQVDAFRKFLLSPKVKMGFDFWWVDGWGADGLYKDEQFFTDNKDADKMDLGVDGYKHLNPQLWLNFFYYKTSMEAQNNIRGITLSRWGGIGSHRYPVGFSGDSCSKWKTLAYQVYFTYTGGNVLTNYWSHDLGGFLSAEIPKDLFIRWTQFGAFSPIMRTHSAHGVREPWKFDAETTDIFKKYVNLRYRLLPYFYRLSFESYMHAMPLIRAMYHEYPADPNSYRFKYQYLLGRDLLVAPVVTKRADKKIYFPEGEWVGLELDRNIKGPASETFSVPLDTIPIFIRKGAIIPVSQHMSFIGENDNKTLQFEILPSDSPSDFEYYEDDGISLDYQKGEYLTIPVNAAKENEEIIVTIGKRTGAYKNMPSQRTINLILHFVDHLNIKSVSVNNENVKFEKECKFLGELTSLFNSYRIKLDYFDNEVVVRIKSSIR